MFGFALRQQYFHKCVLLLLSHDDGFTKGIILNRPTSYALDMAIRRLRGRLRFCFRIQVDYYDGHFEFTRVWHVVPRDGCFDENSEFIENIHTLHDDVQSAF